MDATIRDPPRRAWTEKDAAMRYRNPRLTLTLTNTHTQWRRSVVNYEWGRDHSGQFIKRFQITSYVNDFQTLKQVAYSESLFMKVSFNITDNTKRRSCKNKLLHRYSGNSLPRRAAILIMVLLFFSTIPVRPDSS